MGYPTLLGIAVGALAAGVLTRFVAAMLYGVAPLDFATFAIGAVLLVSVALAATWYPRAERFGSIRLWRSDTTEKEPMGPRDVTRLNIAETGDILQGTCDLACHLDNVH